jgi:hypothetical protein
LHEATGVKRRDTVGLRARAPYFYPDVNKRFCKKQQMQWSKRGAHLLLQARVKTLDREWATVFKQWYPDINIEEWDEAA